MRQALTMDVLATDLADYLVRKGVSVSLWYTNCDSELGCDADSIPRNPSHFRARGRAGGISEVPAEQALIARLPRPQWEVRRRHS